MSTSGSKQAGSIVVGTAGHIDHGKTKLVQALTGIDCDRLAEEKQRGITIELGFAPFVIEGVNVGFVDVPGHERFVKNMLAGAGGIDAVLFVVAGDESVMPQTREHVEICDLLEIGAAVVAVTKIDLADGDTVELVSLEMAELLESTRFSGCPIVIVSSVTGKGLEELRAALKALAGQVPPRTEGLLPRLPVDRVFTMKGFGTVVTGTLISGRLSVGEAVEFLPSGKRSQIKGLQIHNDSVDEARAGHRVAVNVLGIGKGEIRRGEVLSRVDSLRATSLLDLRCRLLPSAQRNLEQNQRVRFHTGSAELLGRVGILSARTLKPGEEGFIRIRLETPAAAVVGDRFVIRQYSPMITIGGGTVLDNCPKGLRGSDRSELIRRLKEMASVGLRGRVGLAVKYWDGLLAADLLTARFGLEKIEGESILRALAESGEAVVIGENPLSVASSGYLESAAAGLLRELEEAHKRSPFADGIPYERFKRGLPAGAGEAIFRAALDLLREEGKVRVQRGLAALKDHKVELSPAQEECAKAISALIREGGTAPPLASQVYAAQKHSDSRQLFDMLVSRGELVKVGEDLYYHREVLDDVVSTIRGRAEDGSFSVPEFKDWFGVSRKYAIPLLEYLDSSGVTYRVGDTRRLREDEG